MFIEAKDDSIALSGGKFNCCFMITSANVIDVAKISVIESACEIQSKYATTNRNVDPDVQSKGAFDLPLKGKAFLICLGLVSFPILLSYPLSLTDKNPNYCFHLQIFA